jgi:hypothetical protein
MFDSSAHKLEQVNPLIHNPELEDSPQQWWIEMRTRIPAVVYYFGPFDTRLEAAVAQVGYRDDLLQENAQDIITEIKQCTPVELTICEAEQAD